MADDRSDNPAPINRRSMMTVLGLGGAVVTTGAAGSLARGGRRSHGSGDRRVLPGPQPAVAHLLGDLGPGSVVGVSAQSAATRTDGGPWTIVTVYGVYRGGVPIVLETAAGRRFQVDVLARDPHGPDGVANTRHFSLFVSNGGDGDTRTAEAHGLAALALAGAIAEREPTGADALAGELLTLRQRHDAFFGASYDVLA